MREVFLEWCNQPKKVERVVLNSELPEADQIRQEALNLGLPVVNHGPGIDLEDNDLWVGVMPDVGLMNEFLEDYMWFNAEEIHILLQRLRNPR